MSHNISSRTNLNLALLTLITTITFFVLGTLVKYTTIFSGINNYIFVYLQSIHTSSLDNFFVFVTSIGGHNFANSISICITAWLLYYRHVRITVHLWVNLIIAAWLASHLKVLFGIVRPLSINADSSFPSGHATNAFTFFIFIAWLLTQQYAAYKRHVLFFICCTPALLVSFSRLYLGMHWLTDLMASLLLGIAVNSASLAIYQRYNKRIININKSLIILILIGMSFALYHIENDMAKNKDKYGHIQMNQNDK